MNTLKTTFLLTALTLLLVLAGEYFGGTNGALIAFFIAAGNQLLQLLLFRQDRPRHVRRKARHARRAPPRL